MENIKRLLCIIGSMNVGGAETFLMKIYRAIDRDKYQMDFYVFTQEECFYEKEIKSMGGRVFHSIPKSKGLLKSFNAIKKIVKKKRYEYVLRISHHSLSALDLLAAKLGGAKKLIFRSSNTNTCGGFISRVMHNIFKPFSKLIPNVRIAPSTEAAVFMFGKKLTNRGHVTILKNAIPLNDFKFSQYKRNKIRSELGIDNHFVVGHIGRFSAQKNHTFLVDIFREISNKIEKSVLVLSGTGELIETIKEKINNLQLNEKVIFTGVRSDIPDVLMAFDILIFPSFYEGLPNVVIEAQATGLPCLISDSISKEVAITDLVTFESINNEPKLWANKALEIGNINRKKDYHDIFVKSGYELDILKKKFIQLVFETNHENKL